MKKFLKKLWDWITKNDDKIDLAIHILDDISHLTPTQLVDIPADKLHEFWDKIHKISTNKSFQR
jgi:hypothetical protein